METALYSQIHRIEANHWWYAGRRSIVFDWVKRLAARYQRPRVLDIGCGTGFNLQQLNANGLTDATGLDVAPEAIAYCRDRGFRRLVRGDGARLPFRGASFDIVLALDLIEHISDDRAALAEVARVLRPGGTIILFTPAFKFLWSGQDEVSHHFRRYTSAELGRKLAGAGFAIEKLTYANTLLFPLVWMGRSVLRFSRSPAPENELHPAWSNGVLRTVFSAERQILRHASFPFGVSLLAVGVRG